MSCTKCVVCLTYRQKRVGSALKLTDRANTNVVSPLKVHFTKPKRHPEMELTQLAGEYKKNICIYISVHECSSI
jgi:hypothetical protein